MCQMDLQYSIGVVGQWVLVYDHRQSQRERGSGGTLLPGPDDKQRVRTNYKKEKKLVTDISMQLHRQLLRGPTVSKSAYHVLRSFMDPGDDLNK